MADATTISDYALNAPPVFRLTQDSNGDTIIRDYATNAPLWRLNGDIGGGVEVMSRTQRLSFTPAPGELIYDTNERKLYVGDGRTVGGVEVSGGMVPTLLAMGDWTDELEDVYTPGDGIWTR